MYFTPYSPFVITKPPCMHLDSASFGNFNRSIIRGGDKARKWENGRLVNESGQFAMIFIEFSFKLMQ